MTVQTGKFYLFSGEHYYPRGGWEDFKGTFDTVEEAVVSPEIYKWGWWQVVDASTLTIASQGDEDGVLT